MRRYWPLLLLLASVWGASYLFVEVAVEGGLAVVLSSFAYLCGTVFGQRIGGLALILTGVALGSGTLGPGAPAAAEAPAR